MTKNEFEQLVVDYGDLQFDMCSASGEGNDRKFSAFEEQALKIKEKIVDEWGKLATINAHHERIGVMGAKLG